MLEEAAAQSTSIAEAVRRLGAKEVGGTQAHVGRRLRSFEIDISHFESMRRKPRQRLKEVPWAEFADAVSQARSVAQVARILGVADTTDFRRQYRTRVVELGLDVSHFLGQAHARGTRSTRRTDPADILIADPTARGRTKTRLLRPAMIEVGILHHCALCETGPEWRGRQLTLEIDHINGDMTDNRPKTCGSSARTATRPRRASAAKRSARPGPWTVPTGRDSLRWGRSPIGRRQ
ncbi:HNH endonuclease [Catenulispora sp. MAP12-49]|uniref:HNH endonuclease n=1 Tax=Catenulispora sp. MAP12-49 TaxID=3156302 RepID=UPI0035113C43